MSNGNLLYLLMCIGMFVVFAVVLAYYSWEQAQRGPEMIGSVPKDDRQIDHADDHGHGHVAHA